MKHKRKEIIVEDIIVRFRIEEDNKATEKRSRGNSAISSVNIVEEDPTKLKNRKKTSGPKSKFLRRNSMEVSSIVAHVVIRLLNFGIPKRTRTSRIKQT